MDIRYEILDREKTERHADALIALAHDMPWEYWTREHLLQDRPAKWEISVIAFEGDEPIGYGLSSMTGPDSAHIHRIIIGPAGRSRGVGREIMLRMVENAGAHGAKTMVSKIHVDNKRPGPIWDKFGFKRWVRVENDHEIIEGDVEHLIQKNRGEPAS
jgi:GNAT superfamily N-acetyltransferase